MTQTVQDIRGKVQEMLNMAQMDGAFRQMLQVNPGAALCAAGVPNAMLSESSDADSCSWTCLVTCLITSISAD